MTSIAFSEAVSVTVDLHRDTTDDPALGGAAHPLGALDLSDLAVTPDLMPGTSNQSGSQITCATCTFSIGLCGH